MSPRMTFLALADRIRAKGGPAGFDLRPTRLSVVRRTWTGGRVGADAPVGSARYVDSVLDLPQIYGARQLTTREIAGSGGRYEVGDVLVGPITPQHTRTDGTSGGYAETDLKPGAARGTEVFYTLTGAHPGEYALKELRTLRVFRYEVVLGRRQTTP